jgi:hypothetical protein
MTDKRRVALIALEAFVAIAAIGGGVSLLTGTLPMSTDSLQGSPFADYQIPGLVLALGIGGSNLLAVAAMLYARHDAGDVVSTGAGLVLIGYEVVEAAVIGFASPLQPFFFGIGLLMVALAASEWRTEKLHLAQ